MYDASRLRWPVCANFPTKSHNTSTTDSQLNDNTTTKQLMCCVVVNTTRPQRQRNNFTTQWKCKFYTSVVLWNCCVVVELCSQHNHTTTTTQHINCWVVVVLPLWCRWVVNLLLLCCGSLWESWHIHATVQSTSSSTLVHCTLW